jgi:7SK snRNA methylphosphate capping enzyme
LSPHIIPGRNYSNWAILEQVNHCKYIDLGKMDQQNAPTIPEASETITTPTPALTPNQLNKLRHEAHKHGNYTSYYTFRSQNVPDPRLTQLKTFVQGRRTLDLGCNAGKLTLELATHFAASQVVGVDLDTGLIASARESKQAALSQGQSVENVTFEEFDFANTWPFTGAAAGQWDVVMLLSVVKWLHLNNSDSVLVELFRRLYEVVAPGGFLVLEPQDWANYKRAAKKCPSLRENLKKLELRPPFTETLVEGGWEEVDGWERDEFGFERSVRIWRKPS